jgi:NifU-like protein involved in Fe-S cluster formation
MGRAPKGCDVNVFSPQTRAYFNSARGFGRLASATHQSEVGQVENGQYFRLQIQLDAAGIVNDLAFDCPRCVPAIACGGYLYERLVGQRVDQEISLEQVLGALGGLPIQRSFCAWMAVQAFKQVRSMLAHTLENTAESRFS